MRLVDIPVLRPAQSPGNLDERQSSPHSGGGAPNLERAKDQGFFTECYPDLKPLLSRDVGTPYWKGHLSLVEGSRALVVAMEDPNDRARSHSVIGIAGLGRAHFPLALSEREVLGSNILRLAPGKTAKARIPVGEREVPGSNVFQFAVPESARVRISVAGRAEPRSLSCSSSYKKRDYDGD
jgi:hypothetical protein